MKKNWVIVIFLGAILPLLAYYFYESVAEEYYTVARGTKGYENLLLGKELDILAFTDEVLVESGKVAEVGLTLVASSRDFLLKGLQKGDYDGVLVDSAIYGSEVGKYLYSDTIFDLGPVLILPKESTVSSLKDLKGKTVAISKDSALFSSGFSSYSDLIIVPIETIWKGFNLLSTDKADALIYDALPAYLYIQNLYKEEFKIISPPLLDMGLKLVVLNNVKGKELLTKFNKGLEELEESGRYTSLLNKWGFENYPVDFEN